ncbi:unnamed protein product, partial [Prorocentrum cordatum]
TKGEVVEGGEQKARVSAHVCTSANDKHWPRTKRGTLARSFSVHTPYTRRAHARAVHVHARGPEELTIDMHGARASVAQAPHAECMLGAVPAVIQRRPAARGSEDEDEDEDERGKENREEEEEEEEEVFFAARTMPGGPRPSSPQEKEDGRALRHGVPPAPEEEEEEEEERPTRAQSPHDAPSSGPPSRSGSEVRGRARHLQPAPTSTRDAQHAQRDAGRGAGCVGAPLRCHAGAALVAAAAHAGRPVEAVPGPAPARRGIRAVLVGPSAAPQAEQLAGVARRARVRGARPRPHALARLAAAQVPSGQVQFRLCSLRNTACAFVGSGPTSVHCALRHHLQGLTLQLPPVLSSHAAPLGPGRLSRPASTAHHGIAAFRPSAEAGEQRSAFWVKPHARAEMPAK